MCTTKYLTDVFISNFELFIIKLSSVADWLNLGVIIRAVDLLGFIVSLFIFIQFEQHSFIIKARSTVYTKISN